MVKLISELLCLVYIGSLRIAVGENKLTQEQFEQLRETKEYKALKEKGKFRVEDVEDEPAEEAGEKTVDKMSKAELVAYGKSLGLDGLSAKNKDEIIALIQDIED